MKCFNKKIKFCSLLIAFIMIFNLSLSIIGFAEGEEENENIPAEEEVTEEELTEEEQLKQGLDEALEEKLENEFEEAQREDISVSGDENFDTTTETEEVESITPEESETKTIDTFEYHFFKAAGFLVPQLYDLQENTPMTRAQFVSIASRLCGLGNVEFPSTNSFWDVPANHWATSYIYGMRDMGSVNGYSDFEFRPDDAITFGQVLKITLNILGYGDSVVQKYGSYPDGHIRLGSSLDLLPSVLSGDSKVSCGTALKILYKATEVKLLDAEVKSGDYIYTKSGETLLSQYHNIYEGEGILTFDGYTGLDSDGKFSQDQVAIGGKVLNRNGINVQHLLGMKVRYFYCADNSQHELIYVEAKENINDVLIINAEDIAVDSPEFSIDRICYYDKNDKVRTADISKHAKFIYNGRSYDEFGSNDYKIDAGILKLISNSASGVYDVIIAEEFKNCFVAAVDIDSKKIYDTYGGVIELEESDYVTIFNDSGDTITIEDIQKYNIVSYLYSLDGENLILYVSDNKISGKIDGASEERRGITYTVGDNEYRLAANVKDAIAKNLVNVQNPALGATYDVYLDKSGCIAGLIMIEEKLQYALLCANTMDKGFNADRCLMQLVLENGELITVQTAEKFTVNGSRSTSSTLNSQLNTYSDYPVIRVGFNSLGEVREVELAADRTTYADENAAGDKTSSGYNEEKFTMDYASDKVSYRGYSIMVFHDNYRMSPATVVFHLPYKEDGEIEPEEIKVVPSSYLSHGEPYFVTLYDADATLSAGAVVVQPTRYGYYDGLFVVKKVLNVTNEYGEDVIRVEGFRKGVLTTLTEQKPGLLLEMKQTLASKRPDLEGLDATSVKKGDVFRFYSVDSEIIAGQLLYSCSIPKQRYVATYSNVNLDTLYNNAVIVVGPVHTVSEYALTTVNPDVRNQIKGDIASHALYNTIILVYDSKEKDVYLGKRSDILPNVTPDKTGTISFDENSTWVMIDRYGQTADEIVVIK